MNRRTFLKSIATVYGAAVVCPGELVKGKTEREILLEKFRAAALNTKDKDGKPIFIIGERSKHIVMADIKCTATKCYREYLGQNRCHNCLWNAKDVPTTKLILRKQKNPCPHPSWPEIVEVPIDYQGEEWSE